MLDGLLEVGLEWDTQDNYLWTEHLDHCIQELALMFAHVQKSNSWNHNSNKRCTISVLLCVTQFFRLVECRTICKKNQCCFYKHLLQFIIANNTLYFIFYCKQVMNFAFIQVPCCYCEQILDSKRQDLIQP